MSVTRLTFSARLSALVIGCAAFAAQASDIDTAAVESTLAKVAEPLMREYRIPGMSLAVTVGGKDYIRHYGVASKQGAEPVTNETLFEIGSISKTFTATLAARAEAEGKLRFSDSPVDYLPTLRGTPLDKVTLLQLATHTAGGLGLQVPESITGEESLREYFKTWKPTVTPGERRVYSNLGMGLLGAAAAAATNESFESAVGKRIFQPLGMRSSFYRVPEGRGKDYAQGYTRQDAPVRLNAGMFWAEAYGVRSNAADLLRFLKANMQDAGAERALQQAMKTAQQGYVRSGELLQGLVWEQYPWPADLQRLLEGNSDSMVYHAVAATKLEQPTQAGPEVMINKTGSTNGFAAYVAFVPSRRLGLVMLANKNFPAAARVRAAHALLAELGEMTGSGR